MGMDLTSDAGGHFHFNNFQWSRILELAELHGWEPAGTTEPLPPEDDDFEDDEELGEGVGEDAPPAREWSGTYFTNDGQGVTAEEARNLADSLERALADLPHHDALGHKAVETPVPPEQLDDFRASGLVRPGETVIRSIPHDAEVSPFELFSGDRKGKVRDFIAFCREGGFRIF